MPGAGGRHAVLAATVALHVLLAALFMLRQPERQPEPAANWIEMVRIAPPRPVVVPPPVRGQPAKTQVASRARQATPVLPDQPPVRAPAPAPVSELVFPEAPVTKPDTFELARAAAGSVDKDLRKQFPERALLRSPPKTDQQKLVAGITRAVAPPKFYEPARITKIQDQGAGWGRRVEKVQTAFGTYCITYEGNHGGDGRDVFKDALQPKLRTCPREE
jgi:hypothetical protein